MESAQQTWTAGSSWEPYHKRILWYVILRLEKHIVNWFFSFKYVNVKVAFFNISKYLSKIYGCNWELGLTPNLSPDFGLLLKL